MEIYFYYENYNLLIFDLKISLILFKKIFNNISILKEKILIFAILSKFKTYYLNIINIF